jgi:hypothetical protein
MRIHVLIVLPKGGSQIHRRHNRFSPHGILKHGEAGQQADEEEEGCFFETLHASSGAKQAIRVLAVTKRRCLQQWPFPESSFILRGVPCPSILGLSATAAAVSCCRCELAASAGTSRLEPRFRPADPFASAEFRIGPMIVQSH